MENEVYKFCEYKKANFYSLLRCQISKFNKKHKYLNKEQARLLLMKMKTFYKSVLTGVSLAGALYFGFNSHDINKKLGETEKALTETQSYLYILKKEQTEINNTVKSRKEIKTADNLKEQGKIVHSTRSDLEYHKSYNGFWEDEWNNNEREISKTFDGPVRITIKKEYNYDGKDLGEVLVEYTIPAIYPKQDNARLKIKECLNGLEEIKKEYYSENTGLTNMLEIDLPRLTTTVLSPVITNLFNLYNSLLPVNEAKYLNGKSIDDSTYKDERRTLNEIAAKLNSLSEDFQRAPLPINLKSKVDSTTKNVIETKKIRNDIQTKAKTIRSKRNLYYITSGIFSFIAIGAGLSLIHSNKNKSH